MHFHPIVPSYSPGNMIPHENLNERMMTGQESLIPRDRLVFQLTTKHVLKLLRRGSSSPLAG